MIDRNMAAKICRDRAGKAEESRNHYQGILPETEVSRQRYYVEKRSAKIWHARSATFDSMPDGVQVEQWEVDAPFTDQELLTNPL